jgi:hypothetical protein
MAKLPGEAEAAQPAGGFVRRALVNYLSGDIG